MCFSVSRLKVWIRIFFLVWFSFLIFLLNGLVMNEEL